MRYLRNLVLLLVLLVAGQHAVPVQATSTDDLYVAIGQALSAVASEDRAALNQAIDELTDSTLCCRPEARRSY